MANEREPISLSFGIDQTVDTAGAMILDALHSDDGVITASPDEVQSIVSNEQAQKQTPQAPKRPKKELGPMEQAPAKEEQKEEINLTKDFLESFHADEDEEQEETEDAQETSTEDDKDAKSGSTEDIPVWTSLSNDLYKLGMFTAETDEEGNEVFVPASTPEEFKDRWEVEMKKGVQSTISNFLGRFGEDYQDAFDAIYVNGVNPKDYFSTQIEIQNLKELDLTKVENQKLIIRKALVDQGFEEDDIQEEITRLEDYGDLEKLSQRYHKVIAKKEEARLEQLAAAKQAEIKRQEEIEEHYANNVFNILKNKYTTKDFDGIPVNKAFAEQTMDYLTTKKYKLPGGELLTEFEKELLETKRPENHELRVKYAMLLQLLKKDPTLSTITKKAVSKETNQVFNEVARHTKKTLSSATAAAKPKKRSFLD